MSVTRYWLSESEMEDDDDGDFVYYDDYAKLEAERDRLREALEWYEKIVGECNRRGREGDDARNAIAQDMGKRARTALQEAGDDV